MVITARIISENYSSFINAYRNKLPEYLKLTEYTTELEQYLLNALDWFEAYTGWALGEHEIEYEAGYQYMVLLPARYETIEIWDDCVTFNNPTVVTTFPIQSASAVDIVMNLTSRLYYNRADTTIETSDIIKKARAIKRVRL